MQQCSMYIHTNGLTLRFLTFFLFFSRLRKYRDALWQREGTIRSLKDAVFVHEAETVKWLRECEVYGDRIALLEL